MSWQDEDDMRMQEEFQKEVYIEKMRMVFNRASEILDEGDSTVEEAVTEAIILLAEAERQTKEYEER